MENRSEFSILRIRKVGALSGFPRSTIYDRIKRGLLTRPIKLGPNSSGWPDFEILEINRATVAGATDEELRKLVSTLHDWRKSLASVREETHA